MLTRSEPALPARLAGEAVAAMPAHPDALRRLKAFDPAADSIDRADHLMHQETEHHDQQNRRVDLEKEAEEDREAGERKQRQMQQRLVEPEAFDPGAPMAPPIQRTSHDPDGLGRARRLPFVYVFGRANFTVSFFGANIFPETISLALEKPSLSRWTTGKFVMEVKEGLAERPRFTVAIELADKEAADPTRIELAEREILDTLLAHNSEYANYVSKEDQQPIVSLWSKGHPDYFPVGVKHRYSRR